MLGRWQNRLLYCRKFPCYELERMWGIEDLFGSCNLDANFEETVVNFFVFSYHLTCVCSMLLANSNEIGALNHVPLWPVVFLLLHTYECCWVLMGFLLIFTSVYQWLVPNAIYFLTSNLSWKICIVACVHSFEFCSSDFFFLEVLLLWELNFKSRRVI